MKKLLILCMVLILSACDNEEVETYDYDDLGAVQVSSYMEGETKDEKYILYYYSETCPGCNSVKQEVIPFFMDFDLLNVYLLNTGEMFDVSLFTEFIGTPSLFIIDGSKTLYETYIGVDRVREFLERYDDIPIDMSLLNGLDVVSLEDYQNKENARSYTFLYSNVMDLSNALIKELFALPSSSLVMIPINQAEEDLLNEFAVENYPALFVEGEEELVFEGEQVITEYLQE